MKEEDQITQVHVPPTEVIFQQDKAMLDMQITTAKAFPRSIRKATENALAVVTLDKETAATCSYAVPRGGKPITGPSVHLAKILVQAWGNMRAEAKVVDIGDTQIKSQGIAFDLESNVAIKIEVTRSIVGKNGRFSQDMIGVTSNAANSIALRNAIFAVIPKAVTDKVYNAAKQFITGDLSDKTKLIAKRKQVFDALKDTYSLKEEEILSAVGKAAVEHVTTDDLLVLIGVGQAIKDGDTTVDESFRSSKSRPVPPSSEQKEIERIKIMIAEAKDLKALGKLEKPCQGNDELMELYVEKETELLPEKK